MTLTSHDSQHNSSRNALRHGLTSAVHVPEDKTHQVETIRLELIRTHQPQSADERDCISELALARWKTLEFERQMDLRVMAESEQAGEIFDRQMLDRFEADEKLWRINPYFRRNILCKTYHGAVLFEKLWSEILGALESKVQRISLSQARNMALLLGSSPNIHELSRDGLWLFNRFLRMEPKTSQTILQWAEFSKTTLVVGDTDFIDQNFLMGPDFATCHKELKQKAAEEYGFWKLRKRASEMEYATRRKQFIEMSMGTGLGDPKLANEARLALRYQITAQNRADKLTRRLDGLKKHRNLLEHREKMAEEREARRLERQAREEASAMAMMCDSQDEENESVHSDLEAAMENLAALMGQMQAETVEMENAQTQESEDVAPAVQNSGQEQPAEIQPRLQERIDRMMKGRSRSEKARIKKDFKAMRREMAVSV